MSQLAPLQLDDGSLIYIEATEDSVATASTPHLVPVGSAASPAPATVTRVGKGWQNSARVLRGARKGLVSSRGQQQFQAIKQTIQGYTRHTLSALSTSNFANVERVTLEFGIQLSGAMGVPFITKGAAESNVKVTVECSFPAP